MEGIELSPDVWKSIIEVKNDFTYQIIESANKKIKPIKFKEKEYAEVHQRIKAFRIAYPQGRIDTKLIYNEGDVCIFEAKVYDEFGIQLGSGHAQEIKGSSFINKTSHIENCETSAVGRALSMAGFGIDTGIASYEEVNNAEKQQDEIKTQETKKQKIGEVRAKSLVERLKSNGYDDYSGLLKFYSVDDPADLTEEQFRQINDNLAKVEKRKEKESK